MYGLPFVRWWHCRLRKREIGKAAYYMNIRPCALP
nr:MAG TPA: hypothetical protein [Crassvirales sp.]